MYPRVNDSLNMTSTENRKYLINYSNMIVLFIHGFSTGNITTF